MPAVTSAFSDLLSTKFQTFLVNTGREVPRLWPQWFTSEEMDTNPYISEKISGMPAQLVKPEGQQFTSGQPIIGSSFQVTATPYGQIFSITWELYRDDKYGVMGQMWGSMARNTRTRQEVQAFAAMPNNAFSTNTGYDSLPFFDTAHTDLDGTTQANRPTVDVVISQTALQAAQVNFDLLNDEYSLPINYTGKRVLAHPSNRYLLKEILGSGGKSGTADNDMNSIWGEDLMWGVSRFITRTQDWALLAGMSDVDIQLMWRDHPRARAFDDPFIEAMDNTNYQRFVMRVGDWRGGYGSSVGY
jgi:Mu-like prophage major head subunit gpT